MELEDRKDNLRLLALIAQGNGFQFDDEYEPPSTILARDLNEPPATQGAGMMKVERGALREIQVREFLAKVGDGE